MDQLDDLIQRSRGTPLLLFKHSPTCGISAQAFDELEVLQQGEALVDVVVVDVFSDRALSRAVAAKFGIRHESPQALLMTGGTVRRHASHHRVTSDAMRRAIDALGREPD